MKHTAFDREWERLDGEPSNYPGALQSAKKVTLPNDFMIESDVAPDAPGGSETGYYRGAVCTYIREFEAPQEWKEQTVCLSFDGVYGETQVKLNGMLEARNSA